ncbi:MAG: ATP-dependent helicase [Deltaproteobacteria bacterium]|nr:ATP-dependent helicase [Deltaproteobacteria bacterium]
MERKSAVTSHIDYERDLNPAQLEAVTTPGGPVLVIAGAGSGKTRTIVYRVAWLVEQGVDPASILLLTFTRKAAEEMLSRASRLLDTRVAKVSGGTFHSTGNLILRRYSTRLGFDQAFSIMDQGDSIEAIDHIRHTITPPIPDLKDFPRARTLADIFSHASGAGGGLERSVELRSPHFIQNVADMERVRGEYERYKKANNLMDYDDLLSWTIRLLEDHDRVRADISNRWRHLLVDEYQDTNKLQAHLLRLLASEHDNVMVVGDDSQSIYSFRGADFRNIMEFPNLFPGTRIIKLEENYRSTAPILALTNRIISGASEGYEKRLFTKTEGGSLPIAARPSSERDQSRFVIQCLSELGDAGIPLNEVAVLFRAGFHSFDLEGELTRNRIDYVKYGGFKFLESLHIKDVLAHLKVTINPRDRLGWARILKILPGVGIKTGMSLANTIAEQGLPARASELVPSSRKYSGALDELLELIHDLRNGADTISEKVDRVNRRYFPFLKQNYDNYPKRMRDLEQLADLTVPYKSLNRFLNDMALEPPDEEASGSGPGSNTVVLSTIHSAKGLEWHTVIIIWAAEGKIPSPMASTSPHEIEEERRLIYVAATRAKRNLVVCAPRTQLDRVRGVIPARLSRFFEEIPDEYFRAVSL